MPSDVQKFLDALTPEIERLAKEAFEGVLAEVRAQDQARIRELEDEIERLRVVEQGRA